MVASVGLVSNLLTTYIMELPRSRTQELEGEISFRRFVTGMLCLISSFCVLLVADTIGLRLSAAACYDPTAAPAYVVLLQSADLYFNSPRP